MVQQACDEPDAGSGAALAAPPTPDTPTPDASAPDAPAPEAPVPDADLSTTLASNEPAPAPCRRRGLRRVRRLAVVLAILCAGLLALALVGQEVSAPAWLRARAEAAAAQALDGATLRVGAATVRVGLDLRPEARLLDVSVQDAQGRPLARVPEMRATLSPRGLLRGDVLVEEVALAGVELTLRRAADGRLDLAAPGLDGVGAGGTGLSARGLAALPEAFERLWERPLLSALRRVRMTGLVVNVEDARAGRTWTLDGGEATLDLGGGATRLLVEVSLLSGRALVARGRLDYEGLRGSPAARVALTLTDVMAADVASQAPALAWLGVVDAPVSASLRLDVGADGALGPLSVALTMSDGALRPDPGAPGVPFEDARAALSFDPAAGAVRFDAVEARGAWGSFAARGTAYLREMEDGLPRALLGQFELVEATAAPPGLPGGPVALADGSAQLRLRLDPFEVEVAEAGVALPGGGARLSLRGRVAASPEGWRVAVDARLPEAGRDEALALWPSGLHPRLRDWVEANVAGGELSALAGALRVEPDAAPSFAVSGRFDGMAVRALATHPPVEGAAGWLAWDASGLALALERGVVAAPEGGALDLAGTALLIPSGPAQPAARLSLAGTGPVAAALSLLDMAPLHVLAGSGLDPGSVEGAVEARGTVDFALGPVAAGGLSYDVAATLLDVGTDALVPGRRVAAETLALAATPAGVEVSGRARVGDTAVEGAWRLDLAARSSALDAAVALSPAALDEWGVALPPGSVAGSGEGHLSIVWPPGEAPRFELRSDLRGLSLALPAVGWSKEPGVAGALSVEGALAPFAADRLALDAAGLSAEGSLRLAAAGAFDSLRLDRLRVGDWLDAGVTLTAREGSAVPAVAVEGGTLDLSRAAFGGEGGAGGPVSVALDRLVVAESIALAPFAGEFDAASGLEGAFSGLLGGEVPVTGRVAPQGGRVAVRAQAGDAGAALRAAGLFSRGQGGALDLLLVPAGEAGYEGEVYVTGLRVVDAPVLASLLNAASIVGLLQQLAGPGILFDEVSAEIRIAPGVVTVTRSSAVGAGLGLSMDGIYDTGSGAMDFRGVVSPFYLVNGIGSVLTRPGEGLLGFTWTLRGTAAAPVVGVNPLSVLAPSAVREALRARRAAP